MQDNTQDMALSHRYQEDARVRTQDNTHEIVSKVAYLIGVPQEHFEAENEPFRLDLYKELDAAKNLYCRCGIFGRPWHYAVSHNQHLV